MSLLPDSKRTCKRQWAPPCSNQPVRNIFKLCHAIPLSLSITIATDTTWMFLMLATPVPKQWAAVKTQRSLSSVLTWHTDACGADQVSRPAIVSHLPTYTLTQLLSPRNPPQKWPSPLISDTRYGNWFAKRVELTWPLQWLCAYCSVMGHGITLTSYIYIDTSITLYNYTPTTGVYNRS